MEVTQEVTVTITRSDAENMAQYVIKALKKAGYLIEDYPIINTEIAIVDVLEGYDIEQEVTIDVQPPEHD